MRVAIGALVLGMLVGCGGEPAEMPGKAPVLDAGPVDAGPLAVDAGSACDPATVGLCAAAVVTVAGCCANVDDYAERGGADFCAYINTNTGSPAAACKYVAAMTCAQIIQMGLCY
jgi:hypothetical protein